MQSANATQQLRSQPQQVTSRFRHVQSANHKPREERGTANSTQKAKENSCTSPICSTSCPWTRRRIYVHDGAISTNSRQLAHARALVAPPSLCIFHIYCVYQKTRQCLFFVPDAIEALIATRSCSEIFEREARFLSSSVPVCTKQSRHASMRSFFAPWTSRLTFLSDHPATSVSINAVHLRAPYLTLCI